MNQDITAEGSVRTPQSVADVMRAIGRGARAAALALCLASTDQKNRALRAASASLRARRHKIIAANDRDMRAAAAKDVSPALLDRLKLDEKRVEAMARGLDDIAELPDPIGTVLAEWTRPNGMRIQRVRVPLGVIGIIYESRPNVTADAGALCLKSSNAVILRGGTESVHSSTAIHSCLEEGLTVAGLPGSCIQLVPTTDRAAVGYMLADMVDDIDVIVPRGGKSLIARVQQEARVPVIGHLEGGWHGCAGWRPPSVLERTRRQDRSQHCHCCYKSGYPTAHRVSNQRRHTIAGSRTVNTLPAPSRLSTVTSPPCARAIHLQSGSPRPCPERPLLPVRSAR